MIDEILRERYLNLLIQTLTDNAKKTVKYDVDKSLIVHYSLSIEEGCFRKNRNHSAYTKAITMARLSIEKYTSNKQVYPTLSVALKCDDTTKKDDEQFTNDNGKCKHFIAPLRSVVYFVIVRRRYFFRMIYS